MQCVCKMFLVDAVAVPLELRAQLFLAIDPDVTSGPGAVGLRERPAQRLRAAPWYRCSQNATAFEYTRNLAERRFVLAQVLEHLGDDHAIEALVGERQRVHAPAQRHPR